MLAKDLAITGANMELCQGWVGVDTEGLWWFGEAVLLIYRYANIRDTLRAGQVWQGDHFVWLVEKVNLIIIKLSITTPWTDKDIDITNLHRITIIIRKKDTKTLNLIRNAQKVNLFEQKLKNNINVRPTYTIL